MDCLSMMSFMIRVPWCLWTIGMSRRVACLFCAAALNLHLLCAVSTNCSRTQVQIGEIKFNFLLPHQGTLPEDPSKDSDSEETPSTPTSLTTTPPPDSLTKPPTLDPATSINDLTSASAVVEKPDIPYATLIAQSLLSHPRRRRTLQEIYAWIQDHHAYFKGKNKSWQSSIRHNLMSSPAFVCYGPRPGEVDSSESKKSKRGKDEWGISPEYEGLIGDLSAKEGDTDKLSTKLNKKKPPSTPAEKVKPEKTEKVEKAEKAGKAAGAGREASTASPAPQGQADDKDKSKLQELVKNMQGKGVDMGALLQEALAKMKGIPGLPIKPPHPAPTTPSASTQPPAKRLKHTFPPTVASPTPATPIPTVSATPQKPIPSTNINSTPTVPPIQMPMPLPYAAAKAAPIPVAGTFPQIKQEFPTLQAPVPTLGSSIPMPINQINPSMTPQLPPSSTPSVTASASPPKASDSTVSPEPMMPRTAQQRAPENGDPVKDATKSQQTAASTRSPRGKKRGLPE